MKGYKQNVRQETSRTYMNKKGEYMEDKINECKIVRELHAFIKHYKHGPNLVKDDSDKTAAGIAQSA
jgi:hypothetical protein